MINILMIVLCNITFNNYKYIIRNNVLLQKHSNLQNKDRSTGQSFFYSVDGNNNHFLGLWFFLHKPDRVISRKHV